MHGFIGVDHDRGQKTGACLEGDEAARMFIEAGEDVIHHGHGISPDKAQLMAENGVALAVTPHAGTSKKPTSPQEVYEFYKKGVKIAVKCWSQKNKQGQDRPVVE
ncbi:MAG: hypothetical protein QHH10_05785 [Peptococcaceae bacterium]|nr:hypothetical protein [Peptococcaceae bacterium]MDH7524812.1 hypothetical protein [Peptococcaceae bacterium]